MRISKSTLSGLIKGDVYCETWKPENKVKQTMVLVHGLGEHCTRYKNEFAEFFTEIGTAIYTYDLPGHGLSEGKRGHVRHRSDINKIIINRITQTKKDFPNLPVYIYGHSLGGLISAAVVLEEQPDITGMILTAPLFDVHDPIPPSKIFLARALDKIFPKLALDNGLNRNLLSRDKSVVKKYNADPLVHKFVSARLGAYMLEKQEYIRDHSQLLKVPTLVMVGDGEGIVSKSAIESFCKSVDPCTLKIWDKMYHELHNEPDKQQVFDFTRKWMASIA